MIRKYINSTVYIVEADKCVSAEGVFIIQAEPLNDNKYIVEFCKEGQQLDLISMSTLAKIEPKKEENDMDTVCDYLSTIINNDPFGKYSGEELSVVFQNKDKKWIDTCIKNMRNTYIKDRVEYLRNHYIQLGESWL